MGEEWQVMGDGCLMPAGSDPRGFGGNFGAAKGKNQKPQMNDISYT